LAMGRFKMPPDAEVGFRLTVTPSFAAPFIMRAWGAGKWVVYRHLPERPAGARPPAATPLVGADWGRQLSCATRLNGRHLSCAATRLNNALELRAALRGVTRRLTGAQLSSRPFGLEG
jgi:hypothetical protein